MRDGRDIQHTVKHITLDLIVLNVSLELVSIVLFVVVLWFLRYGFGLSDVDETLEICDWIQQRVLVLNHHEGFVRVCVCVCVCVISHAIYPELIKLYRVYILRAMGETHPSLCLMCSESWPRYLFSVVISALLCWNNNGTNSVKRNLHFLHKHTSFPLVWRQGLSCKITQKASCQCSHTWTMEELWYSYQQDCI